MQNQNQLHAIEHNLKALSVINALSLDVEDRIEYFHAFIEILRSLMAKYIKSGDYKSSVEVQSQVVALEKQADWLIGLVGSYKQVPLQDNKYLKYARGEFDYTFFNELKSQLQNAFFGKGVSISWVGTAFILTPTMRFFDISKEISALESLLAEKGLKMVKEKKKLAKLGLADHQLYVDCSLPK